MLGHLRRSFILFGCLLSLLGPPGAVVAQSQSAPVGKADRKLKLFNIPASSLHQALEAYSAVTGTALIYNSALADRRRSRPVIGLFTSEVALRMMLEGSGLTIRYNSPTDIMLISTAEEKAQIEAETAALGDSGAANLVLDTLYVDVAPGSERRPDFTNYSHVVVGQLKRALGRSPATADRIYQVQLDIWINDQGRLRHPRFVKSSGRPQLDAAILGVIVDTALKTLPPKDMPQPMRLTIIAF